MMAPGWRTRTWCPWPREVFDRLMPQANQLTRLREDVNIAQADLLEVHQGTKTEAGLRENIRVGVQYIEAWLRGKGAVPLYNLMEDAATAEISRAQVWQWIHYGITPRGWHRGDSRAARAPHHRGDGARAQGSRRRSL